MRGSMENMMRCVVAMMALIMLAFGARAQDARITLRFDAERVAKGIVSLEEIKTRLGARAEDAAVFSRRNDSKAQTALRIRKATFAIFKTLKFHAGHSDRSAKAFFELPFDGIRYCVSWAADPQSDPCLHETGREDPANGSSGTTGDSTTTQ